MEYEIHRIIDLGIITLETGTALFSIVLFLVVIFCLNWLLFKPILKNRQAVKDKQEGNNSLIEENTTKIIDKQKEINDKKNKFWRDINVKQSEVIKKNNLETTNEVQKRQLAVYQEIDRQEKELQAVLDKRLLAISAQVPKLKSKLSAKLS